MVYIIREARAEQPQQVFRKLVEDTLVKSDSTVTISHMRRAIADTHVVLNTAVCPGLNYFQGV